MSVREAMENMRILAFDVSSSLAQFRKNYTTTSALTYSIPPPSSLKGLVGAFLGYRYGEVQEKLASMKFGLQVLSEIKKTRLMTNLINTKIDIAPLGISGSPRIQVRIEYVYEPRYRIYVATPDDEIMNDLKESLIQHKSHFTPYLGVAYCIANFHWYNEFDAIARELKTTSEVLTAVPKDWITQMDVQSGRRYMVERVPSNIDAYRTPKGYVDLVFDAKGLPISGKFSQPLYDVGKGEYIALV